VVLTLLRLRIFLVSLALCSFCNIPVASAKPVRPIVVVFGSSETTAFEEEAINRLQGELRAAGYEPELRLVIELTEVQSLFATVAENKNVAAVFVLRAGAIEQTAELLLWQPVSQRQQRKVIDLSRELPQRAARLLAIRVAEFLRSQTAILPPAEPAEPATVAQAMPVQPDRETVARSLRPHFGLGVAALTETFRSAQMGVSIEAGMMRGLRDNLDLLVRATGFLQLIDGSIAEPEGQAEIGRQMFCLEFGLARMFVKGFSGFAVASVGGNRLSVSPQAQPGYESQDAVRWTGQVGSRIGVRAKLSSGWALEAYVGAWILPNAPELFIADTSVQTLGRPTVLAGLSMGGAPW